MVLLSFIHNFTKSRNYRKENVMLGIDSKELPVVEGKYATEMREALLRVRKGQLNDSERHTEERSQRIKNKYDIIWN